MCKARNVSRCCLTMRPFIHNDRNRLFCLIPEVFSGYATNLYDRDDATSAASSNSLSVMLSWITTTEIYLFLLTAFARFIHPGVNVISQALPGLSLQGGLVVSSSTAQSVLCLPMGFHPLFPQAPILRTKSRMIKLCSINYNEMTPM